jgi:sulfotransferase
LDQNPEVYASPVSPVMELMYHSEEYFKTSEQYLGYPKPNSAYRIIQSYIENYYFDRKEETIIDHCRAWPNNIERIKTYITPNPKIICPVRDVAEILASFISLVHRNSDQVSFIDKHLMEKGVTVDDDNRCQYLMSPDGIVDQSLWSLSQAFIKNDTEHLLIVEYNDLINDPKETMSRIYNFLEIESFDHNFNNLENKNREYDEEVYSLRDMHYVRKEIKKISKSPEDVLSPYILNKYSNLEYWKYPDSPYLRNGINE